VKNTAVTERSVCIRDVFSVHLRNWYPS